MVVKKPELCAPVFMCPDVGIDTLGTTEQILLRVIFYELCIETPNSLQFFFPLFHGKSMKSARCLFKIQIIDALNRYASISVTVRPQIKIEEFISRIGTTAIKPFHQFQPFFCKEAEVLRLKAAV